MSTPEPPDPSADPDAAPGVSRRLLLGSGLLVLGAVGGGAVGFALTDPPREVVPDPVPPADVLAAVARERDLLAAYDAALVGGAGSALLAHVRAEHAAHVDALTALLPAGTSASPSGSRSPSGAPATPPTTAELAAAETAAAAAARAACLAGNGTAAVLLACIAASETSHAAVLS